MSNVFEFNAVSRVTAGTGSAKLAVEMVMFLLLFMVAIMSQS